MGRGHRIEYEGAIYHVVQRGNNREYIFEREQDKLFLLSQLNEASERMGINLLGFVVMGNHYHLLLQTQIKPLSQVMHYLNSSYGRYYNNKYDRSGHVFQGRYKGIPVKNDDYLITVLRYIHQNPVKAGMCSLVKDYKWSSDRYYRNNSAKFVNIDFILDMMAIDREAAIKKYVDFMNQEDIVDYEAVSVIVEKLPDDMANEEVSSTKDIPTLDEILLATGIGEEEFDLVRQGSRKRHLTAYKIQYIKKAFDLGYSVAQIAANISISPQAVHSMQNRWAGAEIE